MIRFNNIRVNIDVNGLKVNGWLSGNAEQWNFASEDTVFLRICPDGIMKSTFVYSSASNLHLAIQSAISRKIRVLLAEEAISG